MKRAVTLLCIAIVATIATISARGAGTLELVTARAAFPERALVLSLPTGMALGAESVEVLENGQRVERLAVEPARRAAPQSFGYVLAVDASNSMRGAPAAGALSAARAFAAERAAGAALALVTFNSHVTVALKPSTDAAAIGSALDRRPRLVEGTRMRDAVAEAIALLARSGVRAGSVVVLSDGADIGSRTATAALVRLARTAQVRVFTVGLRSPQFDPGALRALARDTGGRYAEASDAAALTPLYQALGRSLASEYLLRYRSTAAAGERVRVAVAVRALGAVGTLVYDAPSSTGAVYHTSWQTRFWRSPASVVAVAVLAAALAALAALLVRRALRPSLGRRLAAYVRTRPRVERHEESGGERLAAALDRSLGRLHGWQRFTADVEVARLPSPGTLVAATLVAMLVLGPAVAWAGGTWALLVLAALPPLALRALVAGRLRRVRRRFEDELPENVQVLASALRAGHGLSAALGVVTADAREPARREFEWALANERLGMQLEDALSTVAERMQSGDLEQVALVAALHRQTGGNTAEVLDRVHESLRERAELRRMVRSLTAEGRMARWILTALPVVLALAIAVLNRGYLSPLLDTTGGRLLLLLAAGMVVGGSVAIKRIVEIEV